MKLIARHARLLLIIELYAFVLAVPLLMWLFLPPRFILPFLWVAALVCYFVVKRVDAQGATGGWNWAAVTRANLTPIFWRFALCAGLMAAATALLKPELLFTFVRERPLLWLAVMLLYPILSVIAQEFICRRYMFARFSGLLSTRNLIILSGIAFGMGHLLFNNWVSPTLCVIGGMIFAATYHKTRSLALVSIEHALYGDFVFTLGLGRYFYHGAMATGH